MKRRRFRINRLLRAGALVIMCQFFSGCGGRISSPPFWPFRDSGQTVRPIGDREQKDARAQAALQLTNQGVTLLESGKPDDAIRVLERSVGLDPTNGENYYYLSEAWLLKGNRTQAEEFNRLASLYLENDSNWIARVTEQSSRIKALPEQGSK